MSKKRSKNFRKNNQINNQTELRFEKKNNNVVDEEAIKNIPELNEEFKEVEIRSQRLKKGFTELTYGDLFIDMNKENKDESIEKEDEEVKEVQEETQEETVEEIADETEEVVEDYDDETDEEDVEDSPNEEEIKEATPQEIDVKTEKTIETTELRSIEKKGFVKLVFKLIGIYIAGFGKAVASKIKYLLMILKDFFEDRAEDIDRKIKELKDEEVIKEKKRKLDYEEYSTKRIYKDLEKAEMYKNRASNRVNTEKYFDEKIEQEKINNKILVSEAESLAEEDPKKSQNIDKTANSYSSNKKSRIEKKRNEIIELRRRKKEERLRKEKEQKQAELERKALEEKEKRIKAEEEKMISEAEDIIKSLEDQVRSISSEPTDEDYNNVFNDFGSENDLSSVDEPVQEEHPKNDIQEKNADRLVEPYEKFEKENDIREIDDDLKTEILRLMDVPENETKEVKVEPEMADNNSKDVTETPSNEKEKKSYNIFDAIKNATKKKEKKVEEKENESLQPEEVKEKTQNDVKEENVEEKKEEETNTKVRVSTRQDGFAKAQENIERNKHYKNYMNVQQPKQEYKPYNDKPTYVENNTKLQMAKENSKPVYDEKPHDKLEIEDFPLGAALFGIPTQIPEEEPQKKSSQVEKKKEGSIKGRFFQSKKSLKNKKTKKSPENDFDEDMYTNRFMKNIIGMDDIESSQGKKEERIEIEEYHFDEPHEEPNYKEEPEAHKEESTYTYEDYKKFFEEDTPKTSTYGNKDTSNSIHEKNTYYEELLDQKYEESKRQQEYNETMYRIEHGNDYDDSEERTTFGSRLKDMAASINLLPNNIRKRRASKNRIRKNQIYSTSYYKKGKKR